MYTSTQTQHQMEVSGRQLSTPAALLPGDYSGTHWIAGWVRPRASLDVSEKRQFLTPA